MKNYSHKIPLNLSSIRKAKKFLIEINKSVYQSMNANQNKRNRLLILIVHLNPK